MKFSVCVGSFCHAKGSYNVLCTLRQMVEEYSLHDQVEVASMFCDGDKVKIDDRETVSVTGAGARDFFLQRCAGLIQGR